MQGDVNEHVRKEDIDVEIMVGETGVATFEFQDDQFVDELTIDVGLGQNRLKSMVQANDWEDVDDE